jgi:hypothetical protein
MQTLLVHTRRPLHIICTAAPVGFLGFVFFIGGAALAGLCNPVFWSLYLIWLVAVIKGFDAVFPQGLLFLSLVNLLIGNGAFVYLCTLASMRHCEFRRQCRLGVDLPPSRRALRRRPRPAQRDRGGRSPEPRLPRSVSPCRSKLSPDLPQQYMDVSREIIWRLPLNN